MLFIDSLVKIHYCPLMSHRMADDSGGARSYRHVDALEWSERQAAHGKYIKSKSSPKEHKMTLCRIAVFTHRNDPASPTPGPFLQEGMVDDRARSSDETTEAKQ
jgi:hypothetical protein